MAERGRPRKFDRDEALSRAMELFWAAGYEGASLSDLTAAMGIGSPSLYAAFGSKDRLFREALQRYERVVGAEIADRVARAETARGAIEAFLMASAVALSRPGRPPGCMIVLAAVNAHGADPATLEAVCLARRGVCGVIEARLAEGVAAGELPAGLDLAMIAAFYVTVQQGMTIQARDGASEDRLGRIAAAAMAAWDRLTAAPRAAA